MKDIITNVLTVTGVTASGAGSYVDTIGSRENETGDAAFFLNCSVLTGSTPTADLSIVANIDGVDQTVATFTQLTAAGAERIVVQQCSSTVKVVYTLGGTVDNFTATVSCVRF